MCITHIDLINFPLHPPQGKDNGEHTSAPDNRSADAPDLAGATPPPNQPPPPDSLLNLVSDDPPPAAPRPTARADLHDLLGGLSLASSPAAQTYAAPMNMLDDLIGSAVPASFASVPAVSPGMRDLMGMGLGASAASLPPSAASLPPLQGGGMPEMLKRWQHGLSVADQGVVFEDEALRVEAESAFQVILLFVFFVWFFFLLSLACLPDCLSMGSVFA